MFVIWFVITNKTEFIIPDKDVYNFKYNYEIYKNTNKIVNSMAFTIMDNNFCSYK